MYAGWKIFWFAAIAFAIAFGLARLLVPDVVPIGSPRLRCARSN
jgi:hypothetical protein